MFNDPNDLEDLLMSHGNTDDNDYDIEEMMRTELAYLNSKFIIKRNLFFWKVLIITGSILLTLVSVRILF